MRDWVILAALLLGAVPMAYASEADPAVSEEVVVGQPLEKNAKGEYERVEVPDVDGRAPPKTTVGQALLWVPRVIFFPVYVTMEFVVRRPLGWLLTTAERDQWPLVLFDFFTFGEENKVGLFPTAFFDFNFRPSVGLFFFANDVGVIGHDMRLTAGFGGARWWTAAVSDRWRLSPNLRLDFGFRFLQRPDYVFHGLGPDSLRDDRTRYGTRQIRGSVGLLQNLFNRGELNVDFEIEEVAFELSDTAFQDRDPSLQDAIDLGFFEAPPGTDDYFVFRARADARLDTRTNLRTNGTGLSVRLLTEYGADLNRRARREWVTLGGGVGAHLDIGDNRILSLDGYAANVFRTGSEAVPFTELPTSGLTPLVLGAFLPGRLVGQSITGAAFEYRYDIWAMVDGRAFFSVGNVFGRQFEGFDAEKLRMSWGIGVATINDPDTSFNFLVAFGHETFEQGSSIDSFRLLFGVQPDI